MITRNEIRQEARRRGVRPDFVEKDCVNSWILYALYTNDLDAGFVFKGGTALSKLYRPELHRFSEDLDFTLTERPADDITDAIMDLLGSIERESGISFTLRESPRGEGDPDTPGGNIGMRIKYTTPAFDHANTTEIDLDWGTALQFDTVEHTIDEGFTGVPEFSLTAYALDEILAEKIRCLYMRPKTRDLYDVYSILTDDRHTFTTTTMSEAVQAKMNEYDVQPDLASGIPQETIEEVASSWDQDLGALVYGDIPSFDEVQKRIESYLLKLHQTRR